MLFETQFFYHKAGHRISTAEIEDCIAAHPATSEAAVISVPHDIKGETTVAFIILKSDQADTDEATVKGDINQAVAREIAKFAIPSNIHIVASLPKTRSGKVMRRLLRKLAKGEDDFGDTTTLLDPTVLDSIAAIVNKN